MQNLVIFPITHVLLGFGIAFEKLITLSRNSLLNWIMAIESCLSQLCIVPFSFLFCSFFSPPSLLEVVFKAQSLDVCFITYIFFPSNSFYKFGEMFHVYLKRMLTWQFLSIMFYICQEV